jgi:hypothetical protein
MLIEILPVIEITPLIWHPCGKWEGRQVHQVSLPYAARIGNILACVPAGFYTDGPSVPHFLPTVYGLFGNEGHEGATFHDAGYRKDALWLFLGEGWRTPTKEECDQVFISVMEHYANPKERGKREAMYIAVRDFGLGSYHQKNMSDKLGEAA